ncbi:hypothetical protein BAE44_0020445, partial [Dichanthelium oligosanthes]
LEALGELLIDSGYVSGQDHHRLQLSPTRTLARSYCRISSPVSGLDYQSCCCLLRSDYPTGS